MKNKRLALLFVCLTTFSLLIPSACGWLPKIHILSDPLTKEEHLSLALSYENDGELDIAQREYRAALPLPTAYLGLGNVLYQKGEAGRALRHWRAAWRSGRLPAAANNVAWVLLLDGGSLDEAEEMAAQAVQEAQNQGLEQATIDNYLSTLKQIRAAITASRKAAEGI
ncbi:MAG: hypothetical protein LBJ64_07920 [Deltaproteobacteria bacterium]|jgi:tetratricopeptide (TPR) repeat protein|nr:hypothetical protein [Deltaproteobacteria bacterium]